MKNGKLMVAPAMLWLSIFFVIPLLIVVAVSFAGRTPYGQIIFEFTLKNYLRFLEPLYLQIFADTLIVAVITTVATIIMGYPLSYAWVIILRTQGVVNTFLMKLGLIEQPLQMLYNDAAVMLGMIYALLPFMVLPIYVSIEQLDLRLLEAASDLGASPMTAFRKVTLPLTMPGIAAGTILVFIRCAGCYGGRQIRPYRQPHPEPVSGSARLAFWLRALHCAGSNEPCADYPLLQGFAVAGRRG